MDNRISVDDELIIPETPENILKAQRKFRKNYFHSKHSSHSSGFQNITSYHDEKPNFSKKSVSKRKLLNISPQSNLIRKTARQMSLKNFLVPNLTTEEKSKTDVSKNLFSYFRKETVELNALNDVKPKCDEFTSLSITSLHNENNTKSCNIVHKDNALGLENCISDTNNSVKYPLKSASKKHGKNTTKICIQHSEVADERHDSIVVPTFKDQLISLKSANTEMENTSNIQELTIQEELNDSSWLSDVNWCNFDSKDMISEIAFQKLSPSKQVSSHSVQENSQNVNSNEIISNIRFKVISVDKNEALNKTTLVLSDSNGCKTYVCTLTGFWQQSFVKNGDIVHVLAPFIKGHAVINDNSGFLVINPDFLVSSTAVVSTLFCMRKAVLQGKFQLWDSGSFIMLVGNLVHQMFQETVKENVSGKEQIEDILNKIIKRADNVFAMYCQGVSEANVHEELSKFIESTSQWIQEHCMKKKDFKNLQVMNVRDIEDNIWCPKFGVKGKIDLTLEVKIHENSKHKIMPLELKTGRPTFSAEHQGQVNLYTLMMEARSENVDSGLLLYLRDDPKMKNVKSDHNLRRGLVQLRNELSYYLLQSKSPSESDQNLPSSVNSNSHNGSWTLPEPINDKRLCTRCPYLLPCCFYQRTYKDFVPPNDLHAMIDLVPSTTNHLSEKHLQYFQHWSHLLTLESSLNSSLKPFWIEDAYIREKQGLCISNVELCMDILTQQEREGGIYVHTFVRVPTFTAEAGFESVCLKPGDYVIVSNQENNLEVALATGFIVRICSTFVEVSVERDLQKLARYEGYTFRLDKQESRSSETSTFNNLMLLMTSNPDSTLLRQLIVDKQPPRFHPTLNKDVVIQGRHILKPLNLSQRKAILRALMSQDYVLLKGMPGTGKTSTIVALVRMLAERGQSVLLTSHTHSAVDNILLKLLKHNVDFLRIGQLPRIHPDIQPFSFEVLTKDLTSVEGFSTLIESKLIMASTCLGANNPLLTKRKFDVCIVDEASQIVQTTCLGPLFLAKKFVLVGDPCQLPPLVRNEKAKLKGMQESLFSRLESSSNCMKLDIQYRMNKEIMHLCNEFTYGGALQCGSEEVANSVLELKNTVLMSIPSPQRKWLSLTFDSSPNKSVLFLNTDEIPATESRDQHGFVKNDFEVEIVVLLVKYMVGDGLSMLDVGVISPYRCQVDLIKNNLNNMHLNNVEVNTVDQYQGRDKDVIVISCVKSGNGLNDGNIAGSIVADEKRLNVAITRAKKKLIIVGSKSTLTIYDSFRKLINCLKHEQILNLPSSGF